MVALAAFTLEHTASALVAVWLNTATPGSEAQAAAWRLLQAHAADPSAERLKALSQAFEALHCVLTRSRDPAMLTRTDELLRSVHAQGWPRAVRLAQTAWAWARVYVPESQPAALALLQAQEREREEDGTPAIEAAWADVALCALHCVDRQYSLALNHGLQAEKLAAAANHDLLRSFAAQALAFVYLSVGDIEGAGAVLPDGIAAAQRCGHPTANLVFNYLLALVLERRFDVAARVLDDHPTLLTTQAPVVQPALHSLVARLRLAEGRLDACEALLQASLQPAGLEPHTTAANRIWLRADVLVGLGRAGEARRLLQDGLAHFQQTGAQLLPMNGTQMHRALADACEAEGDLGAAMNALRESQAHCFNWVGESMRARLQALHFSAANPHAVDLQLRQGQRLRAVDEALARLREEPVMADAQPRRDLLAQVTHEVRNPIHGVIWMTSMLMMSDLDERQREILNLAHNSAQMALQLCNDVLDLARMDSGRLHLRPEPTNLAELVNDCARMFAAPAQDKGVTLAWHCDAQLPQSLLIDRLRLQQVLMNLLSNATKFTTGGQIDVRVQWLGPPAAPGEPTVRMAVCDTGPGLPEELMPQLFKEFAPGVGLPISSEGGSGLGLALCRRLLHLMGGDIGVVSRAGQGCTFWCLIPLETPEAA